jgi:HupE / UreJ protein
VDIQSFLIFLKLGFLHITDLQGYDHLLFIVAICAIYSLQDWKSIVGVITFFTVGHSITLAMAVLNWVAFPSSYIEFLIPVTILLTCISNGLGSQVETSGIRYFFTLFFGLIHGLGFSNYLRSLLGNTQSIIGPLFAFNVGLELGQFLIVIFMGTFSYVLARYFRIKQRILSHTLSFFAGAIAISLIIEKWIF